ncbi:MAG TPA: LysM peptidoglycan-binding domain-containing protein [Desulfomonilia bacterium]
MKKGLLPFLVISVFCSAYADDITLIKHARRSAPIVEETSSYTIKPNDTLYKILAGSLGAKPEEMPYLYHQFKLLNPGIKNLNIIQPDKKVVLPALNRKKPSSQSVEMQEVGKEYYTIKQNEHLIKILKRVYKLSDEDIQKEYLKAISELNPEIKNLNHVVPGQRIKMPRQLVEKSPADIKPANTAKEPAPVQMQKKELPALSVTADTKTQTPVVLPEAAIKAPQPEIKTELPRQTPVEQKPPAVAVPNKETRISNQKENVLSQQNSAPPSSPAAKPAEDIKIDTVAVNRAKAGRIIKNSLIPAFKQMGASSREDGKYYMPVSGGNVAINTQEIPVLELDNGKKIIIDFNGKLSPKVTSLIEKTFPDCRIISEPGTELETVMDKVLNVSGYFSINKDGDPIIVGLDEKVKLSGKWIVYKDFTRSNVYVINILNDNQIRTPKTITGYASRFGLDIIDIGGKDSGSGFLTKEPKEMNHSYKVLFDFLDVKYKKDKEIVLMEDETVNVSYNAPVLAGKIIITPSHVDDDIKEMLIKKGYKIIDSNTASVYEIIDAVELEHSGPPLKISVADTRTEIEVPGIKVGKYIILEKNIDKDIIKYLSSTGAQVLIW